MITDPSSNLILENAETLARQFQNSTAEELLMWALARFGDSLTLACSFGAEDVVLLDMLSRITTSPRAFVLDTGRLHPETYELMERCRNRYGVNFETFYPQTSTIQRMVTTKGPLSFFESVENRKECCFIRKVEPLQRALEGKDGWITGLRRGQSMTRAELLKVEVDEAHQGIFKLNPLSDWSEDQVWEYIRGRNVPYNKLHDLGFPSIGCQPCTRAVAPGEDLRAGRWWWEQPQNKECGLHIAVQPR